MARNKLSQQTQNERRKAERRINAIKRIMKGTKNEAVRKEYSAEVKELQKAVRATKVRTKAGKLIKSHTAEAYRSQALETLRKINLKRTDLVTNLYSSSNIVVQNEINRASIKTNENKTVGAYNRDTVATFYKRTQSIWNQKNADGSQKYGEHERNIAIMKALGTSSLEKAFEQVLAGEAFTAEQRADAKEIIRNSSDHNQQEIEWAWMVLNVNDTSEGIGSPPPEASVGMSGVTPAGAM